MLWTLLLLAMVVSGATWVWAWRGYRIDDHPLCRRCGFDLTGRPQDSTQCPECGSNLSAARSIRIGHRRRRTWLLATSSLFLGLFLLAGLGVGYLTAKKFNFYPYKPQILLLRELKSSDWQAAWTELLSRDATGKLSAADKLKIADLLLARQADATQVWDLSFGNFIRGLHSQNLLDDERLKRYAKQAFDYDAFVHSEVYSDRIIRVGRTYHSRADSTYGWGTRISVQLFPDGEEKNSWPLQPVRERTPGSDAVYTTEYRRPSSDLFDPPDGTKIPVTLRVTWEVMETTFGAMPKKPPAVLARGQKEIRQEIMLKLQEDVLMATTRATLKKEIEASFHGIQLIPVRTPFITGAGAYSLVTDFRNVPENLFYDLKLVYGGKERQIMGYSLLKGHSSPSRASSVSLPELTEPVEVLFVPREPSNAGRAAPIRTYAGVGFRSSKVTVSTQPVTRPGTPSTTQSTTQSTTRGMVIPAGR